MALPDLPLPDAPDGEYVETPDAREAGSRDFGDVSDGSTVKAADPDEAVDTRLVRRLADILNDTGLTEIEVERGDLKIRVARQAAAPSASAISPMMIAPPADIVPRAPEQLVASTEQLRGEQVKSPMVGTVYLQAQPGAKRFVQAGEQVSEGQTLLIIEAMKTMNPVPAPRAGTVVKLLIEDGQPVEFGEPLVVIE